MALAPVPAYRACVAAAADRTAFATLGVAVAGAASLYVLNNAAEAPEANAVVRAIMALTALAVGLYLWQRQPQNLFGPASREGCWCCRRWRWPFPRIPGLSQWVERWLSGDRLCRRPSVAIPRRPARWKGTPATAGGGRGGVRGLWIAALLFADTLPAGGPHPLYRGLSRQRGTGRRSHPDPSRSWA